MTSYDRIITPLSVEGAIEARWLLLLLSGLVRYTEGCCLCSNWFYSLTQGLHCQDSVLPALWLAAAESQWVVGSLGIRLCCGHCGHTWFWGCFSYSLILSGLQVHVLIVLSHCQKWEGIWWVGFLYVFFFFLFFRKGDSNCTMKCKCRCSGG